LLAAVTVTVTLWPGEKTGGGKLAVVPAGKPLIEGVTSVIVVGLT
jgi:hypothetical protein